MLHHVALWGVVWIAGAAVVSSFAASVVGETLEWEDRATGFVSRLVTFFAFMGVSIWAMNVLGMRVVNELLVLCIVAGLLALVSFVIPFNFVPTIIFGGLCSLVFYTTVTNAKSLPEIEVHHDYGVEHVTGMDSTHQNTLFRSKLVEQNAQHMEGEGSAFLGAGSFTIKSGEDFKIYHVWQERDDSGVLQIYVAENGEGMGDKNQSKAVIKDDVPVGVEPYVERTPVYLVDTMFRSENNGNLCVKDKDTGCRVNAKWEYDKIVLHVPSGSVVPSVDPNLPVNK